MKKTEFLRQVKAYLLDMDGTVYLGGHLLPGAKEFITYLGDQNIPFLFLTNNSSKDSSLYQQKLHSLGIKVDQENIYTSGQAAAQYLTKNNPGAKVYVVGTKSLILEMQVKGFNVVEEDPDLVLLGFDTTLTYAKLWKLCDFVRDGVPYYATHPDINCPTEDGYMPDIGAMIAFVEASTERRPDVIIGKPNRPMIEAISEKLRIPEKNLAMVGDRLYTDIAMGQLGLITILVLSGETSPEEAAQSAYQADLQVENLAALLRILKSI